MSDQTSTFMVPHLTATQPAAARALPGHRRKGPAVLGGYLAGNMGKDQRRQVCGIVFGRGRRCFPPDGIPLRSQRGETFR
ncbi:hypothetical protein FRAHR75_160021 [Frankia sp. Hr75.2]|nr:hypothetical protein FRAHR75_160021 [Frankia sp. Hr75.2]